MSRRGNTAGAQRHALSERGHDLYETPACCTEALVRSGWLDSYRGAPIWEPAAGRGALARVLVARGLTVTCTDLVAWPGADPGIVSGVDFLQAHTVPDGAAAIVTNPPFKHADAFVRRSLALGLPIIALLRLMYLEGLRRADLIDRHCHGVLMGMDRPPAMHREGWTGRKLATGGMPFAWFLFLPADRGARPLPLTRTRWRPER